MRHNIPVTNLNSTHVIDATTATFQQDVINASMTVPVVVDLWATWCGPCTQLSPILEKLAVEYGGRFILAKVDVDKEPQISQAFQVQSIPTVVGVVQGQPIPLFTGALPEAQVREVIDKLLEAAGVPAGSEPAEPPRDPRFDEVESAIDAGDFDAAIAGYQAILKTDPNDKAAQVGILNVELMRRTDGIDFDEVLALPGATLDELLRIADAEFLLGRYSDAFTRLVGAVRDHDGPERVQARDRLIALFDIAGATDPAVVKGRTALANALF